MLYYAPGPMLWVTPLSAFATPVPPTASYYTAPAYYVPPTEPVAPPAYGPPNAYGVPFAYGAPVLYEPSYYYVPAVSPPRGEYRMGRYLVICL
jgi:hypothetical protein